MPSRLIHRERSFRFLLRATLKYLDIHRLGASLYEHTSFARFKIVNVITSPQLCKQFSSCTPSFLSDLPTFCKRLTRGGFRFWSAALNQTAFDNIKPILLTPYFAISYGVSFAVLTSALATVALFHSTDIKNALLGTGEADVHVQGELSRSRQCCA
jgi:hypothetical protein